MMDITAVPQMPDDMKGVIKLRDKLIPVVDLRRILGLTEIDATDRTCIIIVDVGREVGIIVDTVSEVVDLNSEDIDPSPAVGNHFDAPFVSGLGKVGDTVKILLDVDRLLTNDPLGPWAAPPDGAEPARGPDRAMT
jgi:purine-binding chemotaxis protein CheW